MKSVSKTLCWQAIYLFCVTLSAYIFAKVATTYFYRPLFWVSEYLNSYENYSEMISLSYEYPVNLWSNLFFLWIAVYIFFSLSSLSKKALKPKILTYLRYFPIVSFIICIFVVLTYDNLMIWHSKAKLRNYIRNDFYGQTCDVIFSQHILYNNYRGYCGNAAEDMFYSAYGETVIEEFNSSDPKVRLAALKLIDLFPYYCDSAYITLLNKAKNDDSLEVREIAQKYISNKIGCFR
jgi:hypothetical protein